jgi:acyl carrier protein
VSGISEVEVQLKRGQARNELTCYRYDVVLYTGELVRPATSFQPLEWQSAVGGSTAAFEAALRERRWDAVRLTSIPNGRLAREAMAQQLIETSDEDQEIGVLRREVNQLKHDEVDPEEFWERGEAYNYDVQVSWATEGPPDRLEVKLLDRSRTEAVRRTVMRPTVSGKPWATYANDPLESGFRQLLVPQLREYLLGQLPAYMIPSAWVALKQLPLTANGKVDRHELPAPQSRPDEMGEYVAPRTELECALVDIWAKVLRIDRVGMQDNFFALGGHSLTALRLAAALAEQFSVQLPIQEIFLNPTAHQLVNLIQTLRSKSAQPTDSSDLAFEEGVI